MQQRTLLVVLAFALALSVSARVLEDAHTPVIARQLQQVIDTSNARCPDGCANGFCQADATMAGLRCVKCAGSLIVKQVNGRCSCPRGKYSDGAWNGGVPTCQDCPKGSYCAGADFVLNQNGTGKADCPAFMTTVGKRTESARGCVNLPGYSYTIDSVSGDVGAVECPMHTYSAGLKKQRACVPCPTGYVTTGTGKTRPTDCFVPEGYYLKAPGQVAPCPKGEWKSTTGPSGNCTKCAFGVTTVREGSIAEDNCTMVVAGRYPTAMTGAIVTATQICPQKYYCPSGTPNQAYSPTDLADPAILNATTEATVKLCPSGLWTQDLGSTSVDQCLTPPGFKTSNGNTTQCASGDYRADWKPANQATNCLTCGTGIYADQTDRLKVFDITDPTIITYTAITTSADDCYILPAMGLYYSTITGAWRARACDSNNYGVPNITYGLTPQACRECPTGMMAVNNATGYPNSTVYWWNNTNNAAGYTDATAGFISALACVTQDGWGYNGRVAQQCDVGSYNSRDTRSSCTKCGYGLTTNGVGLGYTEADCGLAAGFGYHNVSATTLQIVPCPIGTYNNISWNSDRTAACASCATGLTTEKEGSDSPLQCNMCVAGYGGTDCATQCGGPGGATYGPIGRGADSSTNACIACSNAGTGFSFEYNLTNRVYAPRAVARLGANFSGDCLTEYTQVVDGAWYVPVPQASPAFVAANASATVEATFEACVALCSADECMFVSYDYDTGKCLLYIEDVTAVTNAMRAIAFKAAPSGDAAVNAFNAKKKKVKGKSISSGQYSWFHDKDAADYGDQTTSVAVTAVQECLNACDDDTTCAGITYIPAADNGGTAFCRLVKGDSSLGIFTRTMLHTSLARLAKTSIETSGYTIL